MAGGRQPADRGFEVRRSRVGTIKGGKREGLAGGVAIGLGGVPTSSGHVRPITHYDTAIMGNLTPYMNPMNGSYPNKRKRLIIVLELQFQVGEIRLLLRSSI